VKSRLAANNTGSIRTEALLSKIHELNQLQSKIEKLESNIKNQQDNHAVKADPVAEGEDADKGSLEREPVAYAAEAELINLDSVRIMNKDDDLKTVFTQATGVSQKSAVLINKLVEELEEEKRARQELQREI
jgi:hypothetical protein